MSIDRKKVLQRAQKYIQRGDLKRAIAEYELLLQDDPKDHQSQLRLAALYLRAGQKKEAKDMYAKVGRQYAGAGFYQKAVAAYKQALQFTPDDLDLNEQLGFLYQKMALKGPAVEQLVKVASAVIARSRDYVRATALLEAAVEVDPGRPDLKAKYGEFLYQSGRHLEAVEVFHQLVGVLREQGQWEDLARFYERIIQMEPDNVEMVKDLAQTYLKMGLAPKALQRLKELFERGARDAEMFDLLGRVYVLLEKPSKAVSSYLEKLKRISHLGQDEEMRRTCRRILELEPDNSIALATLKDLATTNQTEQVRQEQLEPIVEVFVEPTPSNVTTDSPVVKENPVSQHTSITQVSDAEISLEQELEAEIELDLVDEVEGELEQVATFIDAGFFAEARRLLSELHARYGDDPRFDTMTKRLPTQNAPAATKQEVQILLSETGMIGEDETAGLFDLAKELEAELEAEETLATPGTEDAPSFEEIFSAFKKGVKQQLADDDAQAHYDLGIAYLEMELLDDAISEFELARQSKQYAAQSSSMIAVVLMRKNDHLGAIEHYQQALSSCDEKSSTATNIHYELALLYEQSEDYRNALMHYKLVLQADKNYRDVLQRLQMMREKIVDHRAGNSAASV